jgi:hypothetical protein
MNLIKKHWLQILVAIMLFIAFASWPYSYYQILRWVVAISSGVLAYKAFQGEQSVWGWVFVSTLVLFNPIASIHFERETWQFLNIAVGLVYLISIRKLSIKKTWAI